jgi:hypothetical protein
MLSGACYADGNPSHCCMGLIREFYDGIEIIHHPGRIVGGACQILMVPEHGLGVVVIANRADINALKLSKHVVRAMLGDLSQSKPPARPERAMRLNGFYYSARSRQLYGFGGRCGTPTLSLNNVPGAVLTSDGYGGLAAVSVDMGELTIRRDGPLASGTPDRLTITYCGKSEIYERLPDERPSTTVAAAGLLGQYYSHDIDAVAVISLRDGALVLEVQGRYGWPVYILTPLTADIIAFAAPEAGGFRGVMSVERTACEAGTLWINTNRTRNLQFVRMGAPAN